MIKYSRKRYFSLLPCYRVGAKVTPFLRYVGQKPILRKAINGHFLKVLILGQNTKKHKKSSNFGNLSGSPGGSPEGLDQ